MATDALRIVTDYHGHWTGRDFKAAAALLSPGLVVEVPVNEYPTAESFVEALVSFGSMTQAVALLAEFGDGDEAMLLYDMDVAELGTMRVAEHFTVADGLIARIRQVHDTAALREAGFIAEPATRQ
jgi:hypothetical protein